MDNNNEKDPNLEKEEKPVEGYHKLEPEKTTRKERAEIDREKKLEENKKNDGYVYNPKRGKILQFVFFVLIFFLLFGFGLWLRKCTG